MRTPPRRFTLHDLWNDARPMLADVAFDVRSCWKTLVVTDVAYKVAAFVLLTPMLSLLLRLSLSLSGEPVLADQEILFFLLGPAGWLCGTIVGACGLGMIALEQVALLAVLDANRDGHRLDVIGALRFTASVAWPILKVAARMMAGVLIVTLPFAAGLGWVYTTFLGEFDINYYLTQQPSEFFVAVACAGLLVALLSAVLLRMFTGWFFVFPLVAFEDRSPAEAIAASRQRTAGLRIKIGCWFVGWVAATTVLSMMMTAMVLGAGGILTSTAAGSLPLLAAAVGLTLILGFAGNLAVNLLGSITLASLLFNFSRRAANAEPPGHSPRRSHDRPPQAWTLRITRFRLILAAGIGGLLSTSIGVLAINGIRLDDDVKIIAHRGASKVAPENTMAAVRQAIADGADLVEIDVQETADHEVVVFHDSDFMKIAGRNLKIWDATMSDLQSIDIGSHFGPEFSDQRVPTLDAVLAECENKIGVVIELKYYGHDENLEQRVADIVDARGMAENVMVMSLKLNAVRKMKQLRPNWKVGLLMSVAAGNLKDLDVDFLAVNAAVVDRALIRAAHRRGREVYVWTVNDAATMSALIGQGVDGLITDDPAAARDVLEQRRQLETSERLLLGIAELVGENRSLRNANDEKKEEKTKIATDNVEKED